VGKVFHSELGTECALKYLHPRDSAEMRDAASEFRSMAALARQLPPHPSAAVPADQGSGRGVPDHGDLPGHPGGAGAAAGPGPEGALRGATWGLPAAEVQPIMVQLARALACTHGCGYLHSDMKPGNVLIARFPEGAAWCSGSTPVGRSR